MARSKRPPMDICDECEEFRQVHQRNPRVLCKNCYMRLHPSDRPEDFCDRCSKYKEIVARGLCRACYDWVTYHNKLSDYQKKQ